MIATPSASIDPFAVPAELEAAEPPEYRGLARDDVRMLVSQRSGGLHQSERFDALPRLLRPGDILVANDSGTLPSALIATRSDGSERQIHVSSCVTAGLWILEPRGHAHEGECFALPGNAGATLLAPLDSSSRRLWYARVEASETFVNYLHAYGAPIKYAYVQGDFPLAAYQTIFARVAGSAEMPSAGRPFSRRILAALEARGVAVHTITLHCGLSSSEAHEPPQPEMFEVSNLTAQAVNKARARGGRVIAVGTTVVRALCTATRSGTVVAARGLTELVVSPARPAVVVDGVLTGFHEPRASHLTMLASFLDPASLSAAYRHALEGGYLWHEFGDVHLIV